MENKLEMIKKLALKKVKDSLDNPKDMTDIDFGHIKKVVCINSLYEITIDYKIKNIKHVSVVKVYDYEIELLEFMKLDY
jgi:hypothetical protein